MTLTAFLSRGYGQIERRPIFGEAVFHDRLRSLNPLLDAILGHSSG